MEEILKYLSSIYQIDSVDYSGGEISILPEQYVYESLCVIEKYSKDGISITSNLTNILSKRILDKVELYASFDITLRKNFDIINKISNQLQDRFVILTMIPDKALIKNKEILKKLTRFENIKIQLTTFCQNKIDIETTEDDIIDLFRYLKNNHLLNTRIGFHSSKYKRNVSTSLLIDPRGLIAHNCGAYTKPETFYTLSEFKSNNILPTGNLMHECKECELNKYCYMYARDEDSLYHCRFKNLAVRIKQLMETVE